MMRVHCVAMLLLSVCTSALHGNALDTLDDVSLTSEGCTLAHGPNIDGVAYLQQGAWDEKVTQTFHQTPWIDSASIRMAWKDVEKSDQEFDWSVSDGVLDEVRKYNKEHPGANRTMQVRVMAGRHCPAWMEEKGVRFYDTEHDEGGSNKPIRVPLPYDNPEFLKQLREMYAAVRDHYADAPEVNVFHGTWSAGPWAELFFPREDLKQTMPPGYSVEKAQQGFVEQLDVLIDEFCMKGKVAELPFSGKYPQYFELDLTGPVIEHAVERLGRRNPFLYFNCNGWVVLPHGRPTVSWGHELDINNAYGKINLAFQAWGSNAGQGVKQGDWFKLVGVAQRYDTAYLEIYTPDFVRLDPRYHLQEAITGKDAPEDFAAYHDYLKQRNRVLFVRDGVLVKTYNTADGKAQKIDRLVSAEAIPPGTTLEYRIRTRTEDGAWSEWTTKEKVKELPEGTEAQVEAKLHTDDGYLSPKIIMLYPDKDPVWDKQVWVAIDSAGLE